MDHHQDTITNLTCNRSEWSSEENKAFENALAINLGEVNQWEKIAAAVPGRTIEEIINHFEVLCADVNAIESGFVPFPEYTELKKSADHGTSDTRRKESEEKIVELSSNEGSSRSYGKKGRGKSWSPEEHSLFLDGMMMYGRGDWRSIAKYFVVSRTAAQVASHAQKFFMRYGFNKGKKRRSVYNATNMDDEKKLVNYPQRRLTDDLKDTEQQIASNSRTDNGGYGGIEVHGYPILESFGNQSIVYQNGGTSSTPKRARSKRAKTLPLQEPVLTPVVSTVNPPNGSGSGSGLSVPLTDKFGASSYDFYSTDFMDLKDLELYFLASDEK